MTTWLTSDQHFGHANIITYSKRPFSTVEEMNEELVRRFNSVVGTEDTTWHLGDFSLDEKMVPRYLPRLHGRHILVTGNHDACHPRRKGWRKRVARYVEYGFAEVHAVGWMAMPGHGHVLLAHMPSSDAEDARYPEWRPKHHPAVTLLHGHVHERWQRRGNMINVGVDVWDYYPVKLCSLV
jgi:calcineurin-like phosphoesterase family protein